ncbi:MAG: hypothetical protein ACRDXD_03285 [Acidimicrobiia bacterium]
MHRILALGVLAVGMAQVGHALGYLLAHPSAEQRRQALGGHAHLGPLVEVLLPLTLAAVAWLVWVEMRGRWRLRPGSLALAQAAAFGTQELAERALAGQGAHALVHEPALWVGLAAQVLVASLVVGAVRVGGQAVAGRLLGNGRVVFTFVPSLSLAATGSSVGTPPSLGSISRRGPPS